MFPKGQVYVNKEMNLYVQVPIPEEKLKVPKNWEKYEGTIFDALNEGYNMQGYSLAGFSVKEAVK